MRRTYQITGTIIFAFSLFIIHEALKLRYYTSLGPGPGFFSFWLAVILALLAVGMIFQATFRPTEPMPNDFFSDRIGYFRGGAVVLALVITISLMNTLGFRLTMFGVYLFLLTAMGRRDIIVTLIVSLAGSFGMFYLFDHWLMVPLPVGMFGI